MPCHTPAVLALGIALVVLPAFAPLLAPGLAPVLAPVLAPALAQDVTAGERVFKVQCAPCHSPLKGKDMIGPSLWEVVGDNGPFESLQVFDRYLEDPKSILPKTIMKYAGLKNAQQRKDLLAYLATLK